MPVVDRSACPGCGCLDRRYAGEDVEAVDLAPGDVMVVGKDLDVRWSVEAAYSIIDRARFFLGNAGRAQQAGDRRAFVYSLEAAVVFARSITLHLQKQLRHVDGFDEWYQGEQEKMRAEPEMRFMVGARNFILKEGQLTVRALHSVNIHETVALSDSVSVTLIRSDGDTATDQPTVELDTGSPPGQRLHKLHTGGSIRPGGAPESSTTTSVEFYFKDQDGSDPAIGRVARYIDQLDELVSEANHRFGSAR